MVTCLRRNAQMNIIGLWNVDEEMEDTDWLAIRVIIRSWSDERMKSACACIIDTASEYIYIYTYIYIIYRYVYIYLCG